MSKRKAGRRVSPAPRPRRGPRKAVILVLVLSTAVAGVTISRWGALGTALWTSPPPALQIKPPKRTPNLAKEYIYAGGRMVATEEPRFLLSPSLLGFRRKKPQTPPDWSLVWTDNSGDETGFKVEKGDGGAWTQVALVGPNVTTFDVGTEQCGTPYRVRATRADGDSDPSNEAYACTQTGNAPSALVATATSGTSVTLGWEAPATGTVYRYEVERRQSIDEPFSFLAISPTAGYTDNTAAAGTAYLYRVRADFFGGGGYSDYSNADLATTVIFEDDPLAAGAAVRFRHLEQLRAAVDAVWALAGRAGAPDWSGMPAAQQGGPIYAWHVRRLREQLDPSLASLGLTQVGEDATLAAGQPMKRGHIQDVRDKVR